jgi:branched-chain amino acid aminotransferase
MNIPFLRRPIIDRTELLVADEIALCGPFAELILASIGGFPLKSEAPLLRSLQARYFRAVRDIEPQPFVELSVVTAEQSTEREAFRESSNRV